MRASWIVILSFVSLIVPVAHGQTTLIDECDSLDSWKLVVSDGVDGKLSLAPGVEGQALRLDFDFRRGAGFCVLRHEFKRKLDENYRFSCDVRGAGPANQLEFKLIDASGDNVWWVRQGEFAFPEQWKQQVFKKRHFQFAWGPSGGKPIEETSAIEIAVAAHEGGQGYLLLDRLTYEALPAPMSGPVKARLLDINPPANVRTRPLEIAADGKVEWHSGAGVDKPAFRVELGQMRELGGVMIEWDKQDFPVEYVLELLANTERRAALLQRQEMRFGREYIRLEPTEASALEFRVSRAAERSGGPTGGIGVKAVRILPVEFAESLNAAYETIAKDAPRGRFPRYCLGEQAYWTVVGDVDDEREILIDADGAIELDKHGPRIEPFLFVDGKLLTWAEAETKQSLDQGSLPLPMVTRRHGDLELEISVLPPMKKADGAAGEKADNAAAAYRVTNRGKSAKSGALFIAGRPFQVLPPWQQLNISGGAISLPRIVTNDQLVMLGERPVPPWQRANAFGISRFDDGDVTEFLARGVVPSRQGVADETQPASCAWKYGFELAAGASRTIVFTLPMPKMLESDPCAISDVDAITRFDQKRTEARQFWAREVNRLKLELPASAAGLANAFRTAQAHILINADGAATQPGSRTYERSWIRDGAVTATSWLYTGRAERALGFADWYAGYLYPDGKVPCVVDRRGPDPVPENDSNGEFLYLLWRCYQFTQDPSEGAASRPGDAEDARLRKASAQPTSSAQPTGGRAFLDRHLEHAISAVNYIDTLRRQRMTDVYRNGSPEQRACFGLMPESISHEGYSAKPMHSYWDDLWTVRGLKDAVRIATALQRDDLVRKWAAERDEFEQALGNSLKRAMKNKDIDFIPGCVELGDFDATSTAIALFPCATPAVPEAELKNTFERYWRFFSERRDGRMEWQNYTPYELRILNAFVRLGQPERAHAALDFFMRDQRPANWNQWAEVVWHDPNTPAFIGDIPHTWVESEFVTAFRNFFVYEDDETDKLVLAAGVRSEWIEEAPGVTLRDWPTAYGVIGYTFKKNNANWVFELSGTTRRAPAAIELVIPGAAAIQSVTVDGQPGAVHGRSVILPGLKARVEIRF